MLEVTALCYSHGPHAATRYRYDLEVGAGELACLTGRSGSGKSTCLDLIAGYLEAGSGSVKIDGVEVLAMSPEERPLTILFQKDNLFEHLNAAQNVALGINTSLRLSEDEERRVGDALDRVGLRSVAGRRADGLSGGEQQRVGLARCLIRRRPVLLLDEPFAALDTETRSDMLALVRQIVTERGMAALMVTHDFKECEEIADRHYDLSDGRLHRRR